jgi:hypothetical protein
MRECEWPEESAKVRKRILVDGEPGFTQMQMERRLASRKPIEYDCYFTVGQNIGTERSVVPTAGKRWSHTYHPVVVDLFPQTLPASDGPFTTIMSWQAHEPIEFNGVTYGQKDLEFPKFMDLPSRTTVPLELAASGRDMPKDKLLACGWRLRNSNAATATYDLWKDYISGSKGEFSVCKNVFVATNSGWFSDRSAIYLASGRPVVMQDTGFSEHLPCGRGLFAVRSVEQAAAAIEEVNGNYENHSKWARELAMEYLDASKVLGKMLCEIGL